MGWPKTDLVVSISQVSKLRLAQGEGLVTGSNSRVCGAPEPPGLPDRRLSTPPLGKNLWGVCLGPAPPAPARGKHGIRGAISTGAEPRPPSHLWPLGEDAGLCAAPCLAGQSPRHAGTRARRCDLAKHQVISSLGSAALCHPESRRGSCLFIVCLSHRKAAARVSWFPLSLGDRTMPGRKLALSGSWRKGCWKTRPGQPAESWARAASASPQPPPGGEHAPSPASAGPPLTWGHLGPRAPRGPRPA